MTDAAPVSAPAPILTTKLLLARVNQRIALLRGWLSHDHHDEPYWWARELTAPRAQVERMQLRSIANLLHVERATRRGRLHGTHFANIDEQRAWLERNAHLGCTARSLLHLPDDATFERLREGKLLL